MAQEKRTDESTYFRTTIELMRQLKAQGVKALFLGDGNHASTCVNLNLSMGAAAFKPDLLFLEYPASQQKIFDVFRGCVPEPNFFVMEMLGTKVGAKVFAVDVDKYDGLATKAWYRTRVSSATHEKIADNIAGHIADFYRVHHRMPSYAAIFGKDHFTAKHHLDEILSKKLRALGLPHVKESAVEIDDEKKVDEPAHLRTHWFGEFKHSIDVSGKIPPGVPDYTEFPSEGKVSEVSNAFPLIGGHKSKKAIPIR